MAPEPNAPAPNAGAAGGMAGSGASSPNDFGLDFDPSCSSESAQPLTAEDACTFPLPEGVEVAPETTRIALVSNGMFTLLERVSGPFDCSLLDGGFYFDMADPPTSITLCTSSCLRASNNAAMQVVLVQGCPPASP